jgi:hypothetical protein
MFNTYEDTAHVLDETLEAIEKVAITGMKS